MSMMSRLEKSYNLVYTDQRRLGPDMKCQGKGSEYKGQNTLIANLKSPICPARPLAARGLNENHFFLNLSWGHGPCPRFCLPLSRMIGTKFFDFGAGWWHEEDMLEMEMAVAMITVLEDTGKVMYRKN
jgi:hypothetical protein